MDADEIFNGGFFAGLAFVGFVLFGILFLGDANCRQKHGVDDCMIAFVPSQAKNTIQSIQETE